ncbi:MAG TPA: sensor histidine kinase [Actinomycetes bacterium]|jgi:signal transduction histidine kinase|nr:sensor histidine kinase [Actinomycetes bacterium]
MPNAVAAGYLPAPPSSRERANPLWARYLTAGAAVVVLYLLLGPSGPLSLSLPAVLPYSLVSASSVVALVVGVRLYKPQDVRPWRLLAAGQLVFLLSNLTGLALFTILGLRRDSSAADVVYLIRYPFLLLALLLLVRRRTPGRDRAGLIDALIVATSIGVVYWAFLLDSAVQEQSLSLARRLTLLAYPSVDLLLLVMGVRLLVGAGARRQSFYLLVAALVAALLADSLYCLLILLDAWPPGAISHQLIDAGCLASHLLLGAAALHPSMWTLTERAAQAEQACSGKRLRRLASLAGLSLLAPAVLVIQDASHDAIDARAIAAAWVVLFLLLMVRMADLLWELDDGTVRLRGQGEKLRAAVAELERLEGDRRKLLDRTIRSAEEERSRIAAELHDGPIQRLTALGYGLDEARIALEVGNVPHGLDVLGAAHHVLATEIEELRRLMSALRPPVLDQRGLVLALRDLIDAFQRQTGIACTLMGTRDVRLDPDRETVLYRVVQEALTNVAKHSGASRVTVYLRADGDQVETRVSDDGIGFDALHAGELTNRGHYGLAGMRERVELAGGSYRLISAPGYGTVVLARIPYQRVAV